MHPLCHIRQWSSEDIGRLIKIKGTIQDVDGLCSFKVSSRSRLSCNVPAHYRIPLHALNKRFGLYRKIVAHLSASSHHNAAHMRDVYVSIMDYMNDVRIAFMEDAARSEDALHGDFRSPALDYYLWLDHTSSGFDAQDRDALEATHGVTFEGLQNATCADILVFRACLRVSAIITKYH
jgi:flagellar biosynthesis regulator FlaF